MHARLFKFCRIIKVFAKEFLLQIDSALRSFIESFTLSGKDPYQCLINLASLGEYLKTSIAHRYEIAAVIQVCSAHLNEEIHITKQQMQR